MMVKARRRKTEVADKPKLEEKRIRAKVDREQSYGFVRFFIIIFVMILVLSVVGYHQSPISPEIVELPIDVSLEKVISYGKNGPILEEGEHIISGLAGPESIEVDEQGNLFTGLLDGRIIKIHKSATGAIGEGRVEDILSSSPISNVKPIDGHIRPRPLGLRLRQGTLYVADAYYGLYSLQLATKEIKILVRPDDVQPPMKFPNDLDISKDGKFIYFTDTSYRWNLHELYNDILEGSCTGRFFRYSLDRGDIKVLANKLCFPNGVQLLDENTALVSETTRYRVLFIDTRKGSVNNYVLLPGNPDNIRSGKNGFWVAMPILRTNLMNYLMDQPMLRKIVAGLVPTSWLRKLSSTNVGLAVKLDEHGEIIDVIHDQSGQSSRTVSQITETEDGTIFAGSYCEPYMVKCSD